MYARIARVTFWAGLASAAFEVVYGYGFNVWSGFGREVASRPTMSMQTKVGETALFGFLAIALLLTSIASSLLARPPEKG